MAFHRPGRPANGSPSARARGWPVGVARCSADMTIVTRVIRGGGSARPARASGSAEVVAHLPHSFVVLVHGGKEPGTEWMVAYAQIDGDDRQRGVFRTGSGDVRDSAPVADHRQAVSPALAGASPGRGRAADRRGTGAGGGCVRAVRPGRGHPAAAGPDPALGG